MGVVQQAATDAEYHRPVSAHQPRERRLLARGDKAAQQFAILLAAGRRGRTAEEVDDTVQRRARHALVLSPP